MNKAELFDIAQTGLIDLLLISAPVLLAALGTGLFVAVFQTLSQVQEMTLTFIPKIIAIIVALIVAGSYMGDRLSTYFMRIFDTIATGVV